MSKTMNHTQEKPFSLTDEQWEKMASELFAHERNFVEAMLYHHISNAHLTPKCDAQYRTGWRKIHSFYKYKTHQQLAARYKWWQEKGKLKPLLNAYEKYK